MVGLRPPSRLRLAVGAVLALVLLGGCGADEDGDAASPASTPPSSSSAPVAPDPLPSPVQELEIDGTEYAFEVTPDASGGVAPGWTLVRFHNHGAEAHQVMFAKIKEGVDMAELAAAGAGDSSGAGAIEFVDMIGGVSYIGAGHGTTAMVDLTEGLVMAMCYVPDPEGVAHALLGMTTALDVAAPTDAATTVLAPTLDDDEVVGTIELSADGYLLPEAMGAGWYHVTNTDTALHELSLLRLDEALDDDAAADLVAQLAANETPAVELEAVGGLGAISPGFDAYLYLDLEPGSYLAVDFMPDPGEPRPHMLDGYWAQVTV